MMKYHPPPLPVTAAEKKSKKEKRRRHARTFIKYRYNIDPTKLSKSQLLEAETRINILKQKGFNVTLEALTLPEKDFNKLYKYRWDVKKLLRKVAEDEEKK